MARLTIPGWSDFQHYKDRGPPWIKLHKKLLDNYEFHCLPVASRALAPMVWLLASEGEGGSIEYASAKIAFRLRMSEAELVTALKPLIEAGFVDLDQDAGDLLARCKQQSMPEREEEAESKTESEKDYSADFEKFRLVYPKRVGSDDKKKAFGCWNARLKEGHTAADMIAGAERYAAFIRHTGKANTEFVMQSATFLGPSDPPRFTEAWRAPGQAAPVQTEVTELHPSLKPWLPKMLKQFDVATINAWFVGCEVVEKDDWFTIVVPKPIHEKFFAQNYSTQLRLIFGEYLQVKYRAPALV